MKKLSLNFWGFLSALGTLIYVLGITSILSNGEKIFGQMNNFFGPVTFLMLFVFSALVVGVLILGRPILLIINDQKKEALKLFFMTVGWLFLFLLLLFVLMLITK